SGSRLVRMEMKIRLSMPRTTSMTTSVASANHAFGLAARTKSSSMRRHHKSSRLVAKRPFLRRDERVSPQPMSPGSRCRLIRFAVFALLPWLLLGVAHAYCDEAVADAEALLKATSERAAAKEATAQDVAVVRYHLLEMQSAAGKLPQEAFCQEARRQLQEAAAAGGD